MIRLFARTKEVVGYVPRHFYPNAQARYPALTNLVQQGLKPWRSIAICMTTYSIWQLAYYQFVIVARKDKIKQGRATSFTFLINDKKRLIGKIAAKVPEGRREFTFIVSLFSLSLSLLRRKFASFGSHSLSFVWRGSKGWSSGVHFRHSLDPNFRLV